MSSKKRSKKVVSLDSYKSDKQRSDIRLKAVEVKVDIVHDTVILLHEEMKIMKDRFDRIGKFEGSWGNVAKNFMRAAIRNYKITLPILAFLIFFLCVGIGSIIASNRASDNMVKIIEAINRP